MGSMEQPKNGSSTNSALPLVAIGASAGGLEPLEKFFSGVPEDTAAAFEAHARLQRELADAARALVTPQQRFVAAAGRGASPEELQRLLAASGAARAVAPGGDNEAAATATLGGLCPVQSVAAIHAAVRGASLPAELSPEGARAVLEMCERTAAAAGVSTACTTRARSTAGRRRSRR